MRIDSNGAISGWLQEFHHTVWWPNEATYLATRLDGIGASPRAVAIRWGSRHKQTSNPANEGTSKRRGSVWRTIFVLWGPSSFGSECSWTDGRCRRMLIYYHPELSPWSWLPHVGRGYQPTGWVPPWPVIGTAPPTSAYPSRWRWIPMIVVRTTSKHPYQERLPHAAHRRMNWWFHLIEGTPSG